MNRKKPLPRRGAAAVELAICMPFVLLLVVGTVELSGGLYHQHALRAAAHESAIVAAQGAGVCEDVREAAALILSQRDMSEFDIDIDVVTRTQNIGSVDSPLTFHFDIPSTGNVTPGLDVLPRGTVLRLTIVADRPPIAGFGMGNYFLAPQIQADCVFVKEK